MPGLRVQYLLTQARNALKDTAEQQVKFNEALARAKAEIEAKAQAQNNGDHGGSNGNGTSDEEHTRSVKPSSLKNSAVKKPGNVISWQKFDLLHCRCPKTKPRTFHSLSNPLGYTTFRHCSKSVPNHTVAIPIVCQGNIVGCLWSGFVRKDLTNDKYFSCFVVTNFRQKQDKN